MVYDWLGHGRFSTVGQILGKWPIRIWSFYRTAAGFFVIAVVFALLLQTYAGNGRPALSVDGAPRNEAFEFRHGLGRPPTLRIPTTGKVMYDLPWSVKEGGCERVHTRTFRRGEPGTDAFIFTREEVGQPFPVGRPGVDHVERNLPRWIEPGLWLYRETAEVRNCPIPHASSPVLFAEFYLDLYDPDGPVSTPIGQAVLRRTVYPIGGPLEYTESYRRHEDTPSTILFTYTRIGGGNEVVVDSRPGAYVKAGEYVNVNVTMPIPAKVGPGKWKVRKTVLSTRPSGRTRADPMFELEFEVTG